VGVEEYGRRAGRSGGIGYDERSPVGDVERLRPAEARLAQDRDGRLGRLVQRLARKAGKGD